MTKWIKIPSPGQFRGEGRWMTIGEAGMDEADWEWNSKTHYLPTYEGDEMPDPEFMGGTKVDEA